MNAHERTKFVVAEGSAGFEVETHVKFKRLACIFSARKVGAGSIFVGVKVGGGEPHHTGAPYTFPDRVGYAEAALTSLEVGTSKHLR